MEKRRRALAVPRTHIIPESSIIHVLFFITSENRYFVVPSSSVSFPKDFNANEVKPLEKFVMKDNLECFEALYVCHSLSPSEIDRKQQKLQQYIDRGETVDANSSLRFLRDSFTCDVEEEDENEEGHDESWTNEPECSASAAIDVNIARNNRTTSRNDFSDSSVKSELGQSALNDIKEAVEKTNDLIINLTSAVERNNKLQMAISKSLDRSRKLLTTLVKRFPQIPNKDVSNPTDVDGDAAGEDENAAPQQSVIYDNVNLVTLGSRNLNMASYGVKIARRLWRDDELAERRLFPVRRKGRPSLDEEKSDLWLNAVKNRFRILDDDDVRPAITAVNQLGVDINGGKRKRLS